MAKIDSMSAGSGRRLKENDQVVNIADLIEQIANSGVTLTGSSVVIGGVTFAVSGGDTLRNTSANKPTASAAHTAIPYCYYYSVDTGVVEATDGTNWVVV